MTVNGFTRAAGLALTLLAAAAGTAQASYSVGKATLLPATALGDRAATGKSCVDAPAAPTVATLRTLAVPAAGYLNARLLGDPHGADWDLAVFDALSGARVGASAAFGGNEVVTAIVSAGQQLLVQACHVSGAGPAPALRITEGVVSGTLPARETERLVEIPFAGRTDLDRLQRLGIDLAESARRPTVTAVLHSTADATRLRAAGFTFTTTIADLAAKDRRLFADERMRERTGARATGSRALPSSRTTYRDVAAYQADLKQLVMEHPDEVRPVILGTSLEGRTIEGVEMATNVAGTDDGRPTHVEVGLHHVREWPSGEVTMEYAIDLAKGYAAGDPTFTKLMQGERTFIFPLINPDGLESTFTTGGYNPVTDDGSEAGSIQSLALTAAGAGSYRRKNCRDTTGAGLEGIQPCSLANGVDLNRNYGAFWGGPGNSDAATDQTYRGPVPYSEPEALAFHDWSRKHQVMVVNSNHTTAGDVLYQPGFHAVDEPGLKKTDTVPYSAQMTEVAEAMATPAGYKAFVSYGLYDVTGATEDTNYFEQGSFGYTTEVGFYDFHPNYQDGVIDQYTGSRDGPIGADNLADHPVVAGGVRGLMIAAGEAALNPDYHSTLTGTAPAGRTLRLTKDLKTTTSFVITTDPVSGAETTGPAQLLDTRLESSITVPASGRYTWAVNPSTRPLALLAGQTEAWTLTCEQDGVVQETHQVTVAIGESVTQDMACGQTTTPPAGPGPDPTTTSTDTTPTVPATATTTVMGAPPALTPSGGAPSGLEVSGPRRTRAFAKAGRRVQVRLRATGAGPLTSITGTLRRGGRTVATARRSRLTAGGHLVLQASRTLPAGTYTLRVTARAPSGI
jgi:hypothetical protein